MENATTATKGSTNTAPAEPQTAEPQGTVPAAEGQQQQAAALAPQAASEPEGAPDAYTAFTVAVVDPAFVDGVKDVAKKLNLTQERAQELFASQIGVSQSVMDKSKAVWLEASRTDQEFGGDAFDENMAVARKAIDQFGSDSLKALLDKSGLGNHPELIRAFYRAGKAISEDRIVTGGQATAPATIAQRLYPDMNP